MNNIVFFLDLEMNNIVLKKAKTFSEILQYGLVKYDIVKQQIINKVNIYCKPMHKIDKYIKYLLGENFINKCQNYGIDQKNAAIQIAKIINNNPVYVYGNYDEYVLKEVFNKFDIPYNLNLIDYHDEIKKQYNIDKKSSLSLENLANVFKLNFVAKHNAIDDASILLKIYIKNNNEHIDTNTFYARLVNQYFKLIDYDRFNFNKYKKIEKQRLNKHAKFIFENSTIQSKQIDDKTLKYDIVINIYIYNYNGQLIKKIAHKHECSSKKEKEQYLIKFYQNNICKYLNNAIIIGASNNCNKNIEKAIYKVFNKAILYYYINENKFKTIKSYFKFNNPNSNIKIIKKIQENNKKLFNS